MATKLGFSTGKGFLEKVDNATNATNATKTDFSNAGFTEGTFGTTQLTSGTYEFQLEYQISGDNEQYVICARLVTFTLPKGARFSFIKFESDDSANSVAIFYDCSVDTTGVVYIMGQKITWGSGGTLTGSRVLSKDKPTKFLYRKIR